MGDFGTPVGSPPEPDPGWLAQLEGLLLSIFQYLWGLLVAIANFLWAVIVHIVQLLVVIFHKVIHFLQHFWGNLIKKYIPWIAQHLQKVRDWLKRHLGLLLRWIQKAKKWYDTHILPQQLRLLHMIQVMRRFLGILRLLHLKWAAVIDNALADVQERIKKEIAITRGLFNQIINTLALVFDPSLIIKRNALGASLLSMVGAVKRIFGYGSNQPLTAAAQATIDHDRTRYTVANVKTHMQTLLTTGPTDEDLALRAQFRQALEEVRGAPLPF